MSNSNSENHEALFDGDDSWNGVPVSLPFSPTQAQEDTAETNSLEDTKESAQLDQTLLFGNSDVPGKDFQPRLLRFGDAA